MKTLRIILAFSILILTGLTLVAQTQKKLVRATIVRVKDSPESCTMGKLYVDGEFICYTLERPWLWNMKNFSCIPTGVYWGDLKFEKQDGWKIRIDKVKGRYGILMHAGNWEVDTRGCILLGMNFTQDPNNPTGYMCKLTESRKAIEKFKEAIYGKKLNYSPKSKIKQEFILQIKDQAAEEFFSHVFDTQKKKKESVEEKNPAVLGSLIMLIDISGSMGGEKIEAAKKAAIDGLKTALKNKTEVAILAFTESCDNPITSKTGFSKNQQQLIQFVKSLNAGGGTPLAAAVEEANSFMEKNKNPTSQNQMILLLADGDDGCGNLEQVLAKLKNKGILFRHETIGLGIDPYSAASEQLKAIAKQSGGRYYYAEKHSQLGSIFKDAIATMKMLDLIGKFKIKQK